MCDQRGELTALISAAKKGDRSAIDQLLETYRPDIRNWIEKECGTQAGAEIDVSDVTQEVLLCVYQEIQRFRGSSNEEFLAWLRRISLHKLIDEIRRNRAQKRSPPGGGSLGEPQGSSRTLADTLAYNGSTPSTPAMRRESLERAIDKLPDGQREVAWMFHGKEKRLDDIAAELELSREETALRLNRAERLLRKHLREEGQGGNDVRT